MRARAEPATTTIRMINAAIEPKDIDVAGLTAISGSATTRFSICCRTSSDPAESVQLYEQGERQDLVDKEEAESL